MKYINADKLIAEIDKRLMSVNLEELGNFGCHRVWAYNDVKDIISSLQQEQPEVDLENYLENYFKGWYIDETIGLTKPDGWSCIVDDLKDVARHFYELGLNTKNKD